MAKANGESRELQGWEIVVPRPQPATNLTQTAEAAAASRQVHFMVLSDGRMLDLVRMHSQAAKSGVFIVAGRPNSADIFG